MVCPTPTSLTLRKSGKFCGLWYLRGFGREQVNKALHTCTSWYAYAAMFGSSIILHSRESSELDMYKSNCHLVNCHWPCFVGQNL